jgi:hypothetical protein
LEVLFSVESTILADGKSNEVAKQRFCGQVQLTVTMHDGCRESLKVVLDSIGELCEQVLGILAQYSSKMMPSGEWVRKQVPWIVAIAGDLPSPDDDACERINP